MKVEIEDIKRIVLEPNEVLLIKIPKSNHDFSLNKSKIGEFLKNLTKTNHSLKGRVLVIGDDVELSAVTKKGDKK